MKAPEEPKAVRQRFLSHTTYHHLPGGRKKLNVLLALLLPYQDSPQDVRVLDIGCGNGGLARPAAAIGFRVIGVDVDRGSVESAAASNPFSNAEFRQVQGENFSLGDQFDLVICSEVLEHLHEPEHLAATIASHVTDGGLALITVPNGYGLREVLGRCEQVVRQRLGLGRVIEGLRRSLGMIPAGEKCQMYTSNPDQDHVQRFTFHALHTLLADAGLTVIAVVNSFFIFSVFFKNQSGNDHVVARIDSRVVDLLPHAMASGWYVVVRKGVGADDAQTDRFWRHYRALKGR